MKKIIVLFFAVFFMFIIESANAQYTDYVYVKGGRFKMGSNKSEDEMPIHTVKINDFYVLNHEVTYGEFVRFLNLKGNRFEGHTVWLNLRGKWRNFRCPIYEKNKKFYVRKGYENYPAAFVSWYAAQHYAEWCGGRLPTEAEWEYLAKKSTDTITYNEQTMTKYAVFKENSGFVPNKGRIKKPLGKIYDLFGSLSEWCYDWYAIHYYSVSERRNPMGPKSGKQKVIRGGSWATKFSSIYPTNRRATVPGGNNITIGFRVVIPVSKSKKIMQAK